MKTRLKILAAAGIGLFGLGLAAQPVSALPAGGLDPALAAPAEPEARVETAHRVCGPYGCRRAPAGHRYWWGPGYGFYAPGPWWRYGYGYFCPWPGPYGSGYYC